MSQRRTKAPGSLKAADAALIEAFARLQDLTGEDLLRLAMAALASQIRAQIPQCASCPMVIAHITTPQTDNIITARFR